MKKRSPLFYGVIGVIVLLVLWTIGSYNSMVTGKVAVDGAWTQVETQEQRRFDLVPNLVNTVKGAANFEQKTLTDVTAARTQWMNAGSRGEQVAAADELQGALSRLLVTVEAYPQLQATQAFRDLMTQLEGTENRISTARRDYNLAVQSYNLTVRRFPGMLFANLFGYEPEAGFQSVEGADVAPQVIFD